MTKWSNLRLIGHKNQSDIGDSNMDITFKTSEGKFNYRVCAVIINDDKILAMQDERSPYYYLPGGRVSLNETAEKAILREIKEELEIDAKIVRPLWLNQGFFVEDVTGEKYHERLQDEYIYPVFIKKKIFDLPDYLVLQDEHE